jgi:hypothetical protein
MTFGNFACLAALFALAGCITTSDARDEEYAIFRSRSGGYLRVSLDRNRYESNNEPPTLTAKGSLSDEDWQQVQELTSDEKMAHYVETSAEDLQACMSDPAAYSLSTRKSLGGCWVPADVTDDDTKAMLTFFQGLLTEYVPAADGSQMIPSGTKDAGAKKDAGSRDASVKKDASK